MMMHGTTRCTVRSTAGAPAAGFNERPCTKRHFETATRLAAVSKVPCGQGGGQQTPRVTLWHDSFEADPSERAHRSAWLTETGALSGA